MGSDPVEVASYTVVGSKYLPDWRARVIAQSVDNGTWIRWSGGDIMGHIDTELYFWVKPYLAMGAAFL